MLRDLRTFRARVLGAFVLSAAGLTLPSACAIQEEEAPLLRSKEQRQITPDTALFVPVRWCVVGDRDTMQGAPAFTDPGSFGKATTDEVLWERHEKATDHTWVPGANISFRSGYTIGVFFGPEDYQFKVIPDPNTAVGAYGDVLRTNTTETLALMNSCMQAWYDDPTSGVTRDTAGLFLINARQYNEYDEGELVRSAVAGQGLKAGSRGLNYPHPALVVVDQASVREGWPDPIISGSLGLPVTDPYEVLLAHELGHDLTLEHTGDTATSDCFLVGTCAFDEANFCQPNDLYNLMNGGYPVTNGTHGVVSNTSLSSSIEAAPTFQATTCVETDQIAQARAAAIQVPGCTYDERTPAEVAADAPSRFVPCSGNQLELSPDPSDPGGDPPAPVNIRTVSLNTSADGAELRVAHELEEILSIPTIEAVAGEDQLEFWTFIDLDNNPNTGAPSLDALGSPVDYPGAELVIRLTAAVVEQVIIVRGGETQKILQISGSAWKYENGGFAAFPSIDVIPQLDASVLRTHFVGGTSEEQPGTGIGSVTIPMLALGGALGPQVAFGAATTLGGVLEDELPRRQFGTGAPGFPECSAKLVPGRAELRIQVSGLLPNYPAHALVGLGETRTAMTDETGSFDLIVGIPAGTEERRKLITIGSLDTALTADCVVEIEVPSACEPGNDVTPPTFALAPQDIAMSDCSVPDLGEVTASDDCGATITRNAPLQFPLGTTVVEWTLRDFAGNETVATQTVDVVLGDDASCCPAGTTIIEGTSGPDVINGTAADECILGYGGDDTIMGQGGNDFVSGGAGRDTINTGAGNDYLSCGPGNDIADSSLGNDTVFGGPGIDTINVSLGTDYLDGGADYDVCASTPGDTVVGCP